MIKQRKSSLIFLLKLVLIFVIFFSLIIFPKQVFEASLRGLNAWWTIVFPALLPFFIMSEILVALGIVQFLGVLLEPIMRPVFRLPGTGAFVLAVGYTSGAPISSIVTADLRKKHLLTRNEAERIICFTNNASPLFMFGAVAVGMFNSPEIGVIIAVSHYLANILLGVCLRFRAPRKYGMHYNSQKLGFKKALQALLDSQIPNKKPLGKILGDAIRNSVNNLTQIGGFIILFSVIIELLNLFNVIGLISVCLTFLLNPLLMVDHQLAKGIASGFVEMTIGSKLIAESPSPLHIKVAAVSLILGWSGLSIHAQAISMLATTDIRFYPFVIARFFHGIMAALITLLIYNPAVSVISKYDSLLYWEYSTLGIIYYSCGIFVLIIVLFLSLSLLLSLIKRIRPILHLLFH
ncbi:sporulation integral membrane protein YlbJ [Desulfitibacter alkalitolerans]|uniref:sporulation integral membrane protein YlbJ n=1 Tax=Desulfitibacter alkalitolerans TaxID=264641 RepID=UPI0006844EA7|nr:sporulation integral membrane protein YlbJ [Desulfitibacter alkalitolerans]